MPILVAAVIPTTCSYASLVQQILSVQALRGHEEKSKSASEGPSPQHISMEAEAHEVKARWQGIMISALQRLSFI